VPAIVPNFSGFISDSIVSTPCTLVFGNTHIIEHKSISWDVSSSKMKLHTSSTCVKKGRHASCTCANSDTITRTLSKGLQFEDFFVLLECVSALFLHIESADSMIMLSICFNAAKLPRLGADVLCMAPLEYSVLTILFLLVNKFY